MKAGTPARAIQTVTSAALDHLLCPMCLKPALTEVARASAISFDILGDTEISCGACDERMPIVRAIPYLGRFMRADMLSVLEVTSYLHDFTMNVKGDIEGINGNRPDLLGASYAKIQTMLDQAEDHEGIGVDFGAFGYQKRPAWFPNRYEELVQFRQVVEDLDFRGKRILDIGAGTGFDSLRLHRAGADITALEYNPLQAAIGHLNFPEFRWIGGSVTHMPFENEHFDIVIANCALHHVLNLENGLREMLRVLKVGGHMLTIGDSFSPNTFTIDDEVGVFNHHPAVLRGVNEQVPRFERFVSPLQAEGEALDIELMTAVVHGLHKNVGTLRHWNLEEGLAALGRYRGGLCMRVLKRAPTSNDPELRPNSPPLLAVGEYVSHFKSREHALSCFARAMPENVVDLPIMDKKEQKLRLLLGWRQSAGETSSREGVGNAYLFVRPAYITGQLDAFEILISRQGHGHVGGLQFELAYDGVSLMKSGIRPGSPLRIEPDASVLATCDPGKVGLLSFHIRDDKKRPASVAFQVRLARQGFDGPLSRLRTALFEVLGLSVGAKQSAGKSSDLYPQRLGES